MNQGATQKTSGMATTALVFSFLMCFPLLPLIGIILGVVALIKIGKDPTLGGRGLAIAAIVVGSTGIIISSGVSAAVAIPAFIKYIRHAKTAEAEERLSEMFRSAVTYQSQEHVSPMGEPLPQQFPPSTPLTPARRCCEQPDGRCQPNPADWNHPGWRALNFAMTDPHYFQYQFITDGRTFTARAVGDLDCDGVTSLFERTGELLPSGDIQGSRGIYRENPTE